MDPPGCRVEPRRQQNGCGGTSFFSKKRVSFCVVVVGIMIIYQWESITNFSQSLGNSSPTSSKTISSYPATPPSNDSEAAASPVSNDYHYTAATNKTVRPITEAIKTQQIENYKNGKALLLNLHATHHGGTSFCSIIGRTSGPVGSERYPEIAPSFACWQDKIKENTEFPFGTKPNFLKSTPVTHERTDAYIQSMRSDYHMTSWEYDGIDEMQSRINETNWEHPGMVSVLITRDPISRLLAGSGKIIRLYPGYNTGELSHSGWWDYASNPIRQQTDNFFFRIIEGTKRNKQRNTKQKSKAEFIYDEDNLPSLESLRGNFDLKKSHFDNAVSIMNRFTVVLDIACLDDGFAVLIDLFGLNSTLVDQKRDNSKQKRERKKKIHHRLSSREVIGYDDVYEYLIEKHKWDIALYEYSKTISLVDCTKV